MGDHLSSLKSTHTGTRQGRAPALCPTLSLQWGMPMVASNTSIKVPAAGTAQADLNSICSPGGTCRVSQIQGNSHKTQVICCNIVAGSYSQLAEKCNVPGVLGLPQSTAGRRYEISIYILQPSQGSDNFTAKVREWSVNVPRKMLVQMGCHGPPQAAADPHKHLAPLPWEASPSSLILWLDNTTWLSQPSYRPKKKNKKERKNKGDEQQQ